MLGISQPLPNFLSSWLTSRRCGVSSCGVRFTYPFTTWNIMAKKKRRRRRAPSDPLDPARKRRAAPRERELIEGDAIDTLSPPNQLVPTAESGRNMYPLMALKAEHTPDGRPSHAFVHPRYGEYYWFNWENLPPSWMDPMLLATMARRDEKVQALLAKAVKANKKKPYLKQLAVEVQRVFEEVYLPWIVLRFEKINPLVAEWLIINAAERKLRAAEREKKPKRKKAGKKEGAGVE